MTADEARACFDEHKDRAVVIFYVKPERALALLLAKDREFSDAVAECREKAQALLALVRRHRARTTLIEETVASAHPDLLARVLEKRFGYHLAEVAALASAEPPKVPELLGALARLAILERPELRRLCADLEASSVVVSPAQTASPLSDAALAQLASLEEKARSADEVTRLAEENRALVQQLFELQSNFELGLKKEKDIGDRLEKALADAEASARKENELRSRLTTVDLAAREASRQHKIIVRKLAAVHASTSWRITGPMRSFKQRLRGLRNGKPL